MRRIGLAVILTLSLISALRAGEAQQTGRIVRIGQLWGPGAAAATEDAFRQGLRERGYVEGRDVVVEWRFAEGKGERLPELAAELLRLKVDVIVTLAPAAVVAAQKATSDTPIVFTMVDDPVAMGLVQTLGRPGGNITGLATLQNELSAKRLEFLTEAVPSVKSVVILTNPALESASAAQDALLAARRLRLDGRVVPVRNWGEIESALTKAAQLHAGAIVLMPDPLVFSHRADIAKIAAKHGIPVIGWQILLAQAGAFLSYGANPPDMMRRAAHIVDKILKGAKPANLPVEQPTKFELVINLKTAKALGLTIPQSLLGRADHVIE